MGTHIVIFRTSGTYLDYKTYNCQELGLAKALTKRGWKVSLVMAGNNAHHETVETTEGSIDIYYVKFKGLNQSMSYFIDWEELLNNLHPDIIQVHDMGLFMSYRVASWAKKEGIPCVLIQGNYQTTQKPVFKQLELMYNAVLGCKTLKMVSCVGYKTLQAEKYVRNYHNNLTTFPTPIGLDISRFRKENLGKRDWKSELQIDGKKVLLYVGTMEKRRNPDFLIRVLSLLPQDYVLIMVGAGPMIEQAKRNCMEMGLENRCHFLGKLGQEELPSLYKTASLFLLASSYEIYGMVIMEAMCFGLPVVSSLTAGSETIISNGKDGFILGEFDEKKWAEAIHEITTSGNLEEMSHNAQRKIYDNYLWDKTVEKFEALYEYAFRHKNAVAI